MQVIPSDKLSTKGRITTNGFFLDGIFALFFGSCWSHLSSESWAGDFKIAIDIGHTRNTPGAISARGVPEYLFNKNIGTLLYKKLLERQEVQEFIYYQ